MEIVIVQKVYTDTTTKLARSQKLTTHIGYD